MLKYELLDSDTVGIDGITLYRIRALRDFSDVKSGDLGGYIANMGCLSHQGDCWVYDKSNKIVCGCISENAIVNGFNSKTDNIIDGDITISGNAKILYNVDLYGKVRISGNSLITSVALSGINNIEDEDCILDGTYGSIDIRDNVKIIGSNFKPKGKIALSGDAYIINAVVSNLKKDFKTYNIGGKSNKFLAVYNSFYNTKKIAFSDKDGLRFFGELERCNSEKLELVYKETMN